MSNLSADLWNCAPWLKMMLDQVSFKLRLASKVCIESTMVCRCSPSRHMEETGVTPILRYFTELPLLPQEAEVVEHNCRGALFFMMNSNHHLVVGHAFGCTSPGSKRSCLWFQRLSPTRGGIAQKILHLANGINSSIQYQRPSFFQ